MNLETEAALLAVFLRLKTDMDQAAARAERDSRRQGNTKKKGGF